MHHPTPLDPSSTFPIQCIVKIDWLIDCWLLNIHQQVFHAYSWWQQVKKISKKKIIYWTANISLIFKTRTSCRKYVKNYILKLKRNETTVAMTFDFLEKFSLLQSMATMQLLYYEIKSTEEVFKVQGVWYSRDTLSNMVHGQAFLIITWKGWISWYIWNKIIHDRTSHDWISLDKIEFNGI